MPDPIINQAAQQAAEQAAKQGAEQTPQDVSAEDQASFERALNAPQETQAAGGADGQANQERVEVNAADEAGTQEEVPSLGEVILEGLGQLKESHDVRSHKIEEQLVHSDGELTVQECMKIQYEVMQLHLEQDITGKIADKTSQGVQTLFRNQ